VKFPRAVCHTSCSRELLVRDNTRTNPHMHVQPENEMPKWLIAGDSIKNSVFCNKLNAQECKCSATTLNVLS